MAQDEKLFEHLFPLPAMFKVHPSVRIFVDHAGRDPQVDTCGGEELDIYLTPVAGKVNVEATEIADEWNAKLHQAHKDLGMKFFSHAPHMVTLDRENRDMHSPTHMNQVVEWLVKDSRVADILLRPRFYTSNQYAAAVTQIDQTDLTPIGNGQTPQYGLGQLEKPLYKKEILGQGQIVGVGDTGLDYDACHFVDAQNKITPNDIPAGPTAPAKNFPNHRKIIQYRGYADNKEGETTGHGTHVAGSVAGKTLINIPGNPTAGQSGYDGSAPEAKVAFFDIGRPGQPGLSVPQSLQTNFYPPARSVGAFIHSNSWGSNTNSYGGTARDSDLYQYENQDFIILVAAGNSGTNGPGSVGTPATAKNIIGVGASVAPKNSWADAAVGLCNPATGANAKCTQFQKLENSMAGFSSSGPTFDNRQQPVVVAPGQNIVSSSSSAAVGQATCKVARLQGTSMATPITAGNAALVRQYFTDGWYPLGQKVTANSRKPTGALIKAAIVNGARVIDNRDGVGQPLRRITNPISAATKGKPDTVQGQGLVTLMHSLYFTDGPQDFGMRVLAGFCPGKSGAGGIGGGGGAGAGAGGGGAVGARNVIAPLVDANSCKRQDFLKMEHIQAAGSTKTYVIPVTGATKYGVNVTLAYSDVPGNLGTRGPALINNLDLTVQTNTGKNYLPTAPITGTQGKINRDVVEKVIIPKADLQGVTSLTITVTGAVVPQGPQPFALVAGGAVVSIQTTTTKPLPPQPPPGQVIGVIEGIGGGNNGGGGGNNGGGGGNTGGGGNNGGGGGGGGGNAGGGGFIIDDDKSTELAKQAAERRDREFPQKSTSTFGLLVFANVGSLVFVVIVIIVLKASDCWLCFTQDCALYAVLVLRAAALIGTIAGFIFVAVDQNTLKKFAKEEFNRPVDFGKLWEQVLMVVALALSAIMVIVGGLIGVMQIRDGTTTLSSMILLVADSLVALALGAASVATASLGTTNYVLLRQSLAGLFTMIAYLFIMLVDAANGFGDDDEESSASSAYKPSKPTQNVTSFKPSAAPVASSTAPVRRAAPAAPQEPARPRPKSTKGEILVALYDYQGQEDDELNFEEGARIELLEDHMDGWASGIVLSTREQGLFPLNYTERE